MVAYDAFWGGVGNSGVDHLGLMLIPYLDRNPKVKGIGSIAAVIWLSFLYTGLYDLAGDFDHDWNLF